MPLRTIMKQLVLVCINEHPVSDVMKATQQGLPFGSTMDVMPGWYYLQSIQPPGPNPAGPNLPAMPQMPSRNLFPVRVYRCRFCGYVETYAGVIVEPETWRPTHG